MGGIYKSAVSRASLARHAQGPVMMTEAEAEAHRTKLLSEFYYNRRLAHEVMFKHRHAIRTPEFHHEIQDIYHSKHPQVVIEGFRDAAKSTVAEEAIVLAALFEEFGNGVVIGASHTRAVERLIAIRNEFVVNEPLNQLFGRMEADTWTHANLVLPNGASLQPPAPPANLLAIPT